MAVDKFFFFFFFLHSKTTGDFPPHNLTCIWCVVVVVGGGGGGYSSFLLSAKPVIILVIYLMNCHTIISDIVCCQTIHRSNLILSIHICFSKPTATSLTSHTQPNMILLLSANKHSITNLFPFPSYPFQHTPTAVFPTTYTMVVTFIAKHIF